MLKNKNTQLNITHCLCILEYLQSNVSFPLFFSNWKILHLGNCCSLLPLTPAYQGSMLFPPRSASRKLTHQAMVQAGHKGNPDQKQNSTQSIYTKPAIKIMSTICRSRCNQRPAYRGSGWLVRPKVNFGLKGSEAVLSSKIMHSKSQTISATTFLSEIDIAF